VKNIQQTLGLGRGPVTAKYISALYIYIYFI